jgi:hypothetical protein
MPDWLFHVIAIVLAAAGTWGLIFLIAHFNQWSLKRFGKAKTEKIWKVVVVAWMAFLLCSWVYHRIYLGEEDDTDPTYYEDSYDGR